MTNPPKPTKCPHLSCAVYHGDNPCPCDMAQYCPQCRETKNANPPKPTIAELRAMLFDHFKNAMPVAVDRDYAEHLHDRIVEAAKQEIRQQLSSSDIRKLKDLAQLCIEEDLLDLNAYDSIARAEKISNAWAALEVIKQLGGQK